VFFEVLCSDSITVMSILEFDVVSNLFTRSQFCIDYNPIQLSTVHHVTVCEENATLLVLFKP